MAQFARENFGLTVYVEPQNPIPQSSKFDLVVMFQVLEHLEWPVEELQKVAALLNDGGAVIVGVPNFSSWQSRFGKSSWLHLDVPRHLLHFSPHSLASVAQKAGLELRSVDYVSVEHDPYGWVQTILNRVFNNNNRLTALLMRATPWRASDLVTVVIAGALVPLAALLSIVSWRCGKGALFEAVLVKKG
jgi:SAM-dependent methyltransferase